jgi:hypothetical protein
LVFSNHDARFGDDEAIFEDEIDSAEGNPGAKGEFSEVDAWALVGSV